MAKYDVFWSYIAVLQNQSISHSTGVNTNMKKGENMGPLRAMEKSMKEAGDEGDEAGSSPSFLTNRY